MAEGIHFMLQLSRSSAGFRLVQTIKGPSAKHGKGFLPKVPVKSVGAEQKSRGERLATIKADQIQIIVGKRSGVPVRRAIYGSQAERKRARLQQVVLDIGVGRRQIRPFCRTET